MNMPWVACHIRVSVCLVHGGRPGSMIEVGDRVEGDLRGGLQRRSLLRPRRNRTVPKSASCGALPAESPIQAKGEANQRDADQEVEDIPHREARSDIGEIHDQRRGRGRCGGRPERNQCDDGQKEEDASQEYRRDRPTAESSSPCSSTPLLWLPFETWPFGSIHTIYKY